MADTTIVVGFAVIAATLFGLFIAAISGSSDSETTVEETEPETKSKTIDCPRCGNENKNSASFCSECGKDLT